MPHVNNLADDNGAYVKARNTAKLYCQVGDETEDVCEENGKFCYHVKQSYNSYEGKYVLPDHVILLKRSYFKAKRSPPNENNLFHFPLQPHPTLQSSMKQPLRYLMKLKYFTVVMKKKSFTRETIHQN